MLTHERLRGLLATLVGDLTEQGHVTDGLIDELAAVPDSLDALAAFGDRLAGVPIRTDWPYIEPDDIEGIRSECDPQRPLEIGRLEMTEASARVESAFFARVCGCMLGKPFEVFVGLDEIRAALEVNGEWPLVDYPTEAALRSLPTLQGQWRELARGKITHVAPDDDINYTIIAMLALEHAGARFTQDDLVRLWLYNLPIAATFGPERTTLLELGLASLGTDAVPASSTRPRLPYVGQELCGALIRADAYGYACLGKPELAAELAHRDASLTHNRTGVYGAMFVAAAIAAAPFAQDPLDIFRTALRFVPQRSRFAEKTAASIREVERADDWLQGYARVHQLHGAYGFCRINQEIGTVINTVRFARDVGHGICIQVMQGNDTDSFGATAGSILGTFFGPGHLDERWREPFNDDVHTALAMFHERSLSRIAMRMSALPERIARDAQ